MIDGKIIHETCDKTINNNRRNGNYGFNQHIAKEEFTLINMPRLKYFGTI